MNCFIPAFLLVSSFAGSVCAANARAPESIRDIETAFALSMGERQYFGAACRQIAGTVINQEEYAHAP